MNFPKGTREFVAGPLPVANEDERHVVTCGLLRQTPARLATWDDPTTYIEVEVLASRDGGQTWVSAGGFGAYGGTHVRRDGTIADRSTMTVPYPTDWKQVQLKYRVTASQPVNTEVEVTPRTEKI